MRNSVLSLNCPWPREDAEAQGRGTTIRISRGPHPSHRELAVQYRLDQSREMKLRSTYQNDQHARVPQTGRNRS